MTWAIERGVVGNRWVSGLWFRVSGWAVERCFVGIGWRISNSGPPGRFRIWRSKVRASDLFRLVGFIRFQVSGLRPPLLNATSAARAGLEYSRFDFRSLFVTARRVWVRLAGLFFGACGCGLRVRGRLEGFWLRNCHAAANGLMSAPLPCRHHGFQE